MKLLKNSDIKLIINLLILLAVSYLIGFLYKLPFYSILIIVIALYAFIWHRIAVIVSKVKSKKINTAFNILVFYKFALFIIGYTLIFFDPISHLFFRELSKGMIIVYYSTQIQPFSLKLLTIDNSTAAIILEIVLVFIFSFLPVFSYYFTKSRNQKKHNTCKKQIKKSDMAP